MTAHNLSPDLLEALENRANEHRMKPDELLRYLLDQAPPSGNLYVSAPVNALVEGLYREDTTISDILERGDFGLGTFNDLDGEMVVLDGSVFQLRSDGHCYEVTPDTRTPFACVTRFQPWSKEVVERPLDHAGLLSLLEKAIPSPNMVYAIRIDGRFDYVRTRSVPRQDAYRPLVEVTREQPEYALENVEGSMAGFWTPDFMKSVAVPGLHLHFVDTARQHGGHLLEACPHGITIQVQHLPEVRLGLPMTLDYLAADFNRDTAEDLQEAEHSAPKRNP